MSQMHKILHEYLRVRKLCTRWIPHTLTDVQKLRRVNWYRQMMQRFADSDSNVRHGYSWRATVGYVFLCNQIFVYALKKVTPSGAAGHTLEILPANFTNTLKGKRVCKPTQKRSSPSLIDTLNPRSVTKIDRSRPALGERDEYLCLSLSASIVQELMMHVL
ncbi:hypothetical protein EVAR_25296_1 [Eumeta japonica]|uniref:Uncharacterized protein n=1 Tax=Eumeta variegata TaxID=151549 RepID=A0A4C1VRJ4_EUMVA|nr:hypothetical protein EVAR_25296_1 [Eumeta japonica]